MYSASLGIMVVRKDFAKFIKTSFVGGGMVESVSRDNYELLDESHIYTLFEPGLQAWGEIIALKTAIDWLKKQKKTSRVAEFSNEIFEFLKTQPGVQVVNQKASPVISFYHENLDAHLIAQALSDEGIMVRSGHFCCHYYLGEVKKYPPLVRISIGLHNSEQDISKLKEILGRIFN
jgi:cysteine desulfurase/selenocysteine lyase